MKSIILTLFVAAVATLPVAAAAQAAAAQPVPATQPARADAATAAEYDRVVRERAAKIVAVLGIDDAARAERVTGLIADQYKALSALHDQRDAQLAAAREGNEVDAQRAVVQQATDQSLKALHEQYVASLEAELSDEQVEKVKDGMTYNVVHVTYNSYLEMLPELTEPQKETILAMLKEAREIAMDAGSSDAKHGVFGKYKGRINNYLSREGYDLKKASAERNERTRNRPQQP